MSQTDWKALARARGLDIPAEAVESIAPGLQALEESFRPLLAKLSHTVEPAVILSETAVLGE
jgi:hypothetical protein